MASNSRRRVPKSRTRIAAPTLGEADNALRIEQEAFGRAQLQTLLRRAIRQAEQSSVVTTEGRKVYDFGAPGRFLGTRTSVRKRAEPVRQSPLKTARGAYIKAKRLLAWRPWSPMQEVRAARVCAKRKVRRMMMFALRRNGRGGGGNRKPRWTLNSFVRC